MAEPLRVITQTESWKQEASASTIEMLEDWLARAKAGEVVAAAIVGEGPDGFSLTSFTRPRCRAIMIGGLAHLQHRMHLDWDSD